jgi:thiamine-monophosphate kinase
MDIKGTPLSEIGLYGLIERYSAKVAHTQTSTFLGIGDDASVIKPAKGYQLVSNLLFLEGIHFDLVYSPLQHLGYKAVVAVVSDILAMNGLPQQLSVGLGLSSKMNLEMVDEIMGGISRACAQYKLDLVGFKPTSSLTGLSLSVSLFGSVEKKKLVTRKDGKPTDVLCVSGDLGSAFMGLQLLEREKRVLKSSGDLKPDFGDNEYVLERQLKPEAKTGVQESLNKLGIQPSAMISVKDGLSAALLLLCKASGTGCRIHEKKIPLHQTTLKVASEMNFNPLIAALNGGEDYELLFTVPLSSYEKAMNDFSENISVIGYLTDKEKGCRMFSGGDQEIELKAQGWIG